MKNLIVRWAISAVSVWVAAQIVTGMSLRGGLAGVLLVAAVFGLVNALIKPVVVFFSFPAIVLTLGLLTLLINAGMLWVTDALTDHLYLAGFWPTFLASLVISITSAVLSLVFDDKKKKR